MLSLKQTVSNFFYYSTDDKNDFIIYKIVDSYLEKNKEHYKIQCINTKALFHATLEEIIFDQTILNGLHPIQGCYIGIEYAKTSKTQTTFHEKKQNSILNTYNICRYGKNTLLYQDRKGLLVFKCKNKDQTHLMDPREIALSKALIEEFDAIQAFYIGVLAGLKLMSPCRKNKTRSQEVHYLKLVKS